MTDTLTHDQIGTLAERVAIRVHGFTPDTAPPALLGYAASLKAAAAACAAATPDLCRATPAAIFAALANLARSRLIPGAAGDKTATAYLYLQNRAVVGKPNPLGRIRMAAAAGFDVVTLAIGKGDKVTIGDDGDVVDVSIDPDTRPTAWADLRGVVISMTSQDTGAIRRVWVSAGEIDVRKRKSSSGDKGPWLCDPVGMARSKAVSIAVDRGDIPQAPIHLALDAHPVAPVAPPTLPAAAPRALPAPSDAPPAPTTPAAPQAPQDAPPPEDAPAPADDAPAPPEASQASQADEDAPPPVDWDTVGEAVMAAASAARPQRAGDRDDLHAAAAGAIREAQAAAAAKGRTLTPAAALDPKALDRLTAMVVARLDAM